MSEHLDLALRAHGSFTDNDGTTLVRRDPWKLRNRRDHRQSKRALLPETLVKSGIYFAGFFRSCSAIGA